MQSVLIYDGTCALCNGTVRFVRKHDKHSRFRFITLQSDEGKKIVVDQGLNESDTDTVILINDGRNYLRSSAALRTMKLLGGSWRILYLFLIIPAPLRDAVYKIIARNRHRFTGHKHIC
jgi:predicted DCC family thiol-disulfide oxidoreductase YuxK